MEKLKRFLVRFYFVVIPTLYVIATILMDLTMYAFMGLQFPSRYYFSIIVMLTICSLLFLIKKPWVQYSVCIFLLAVHFAVGVANIILFDQAREIISIESLTAARQVTTLTSFIILELDYMISFILIFLTFIGAGILLLSWIGRNRVRYSCPSTGMFKRNYTVAIAALTATVYLTGTFYTFALPKVNLEPAKAYHTYTNDRFVYESFSNRTQVLNTFGTYSYYWANISYLLGMKRKFNYDIPNEVVSSFTFDPLDPDKRNIIMLQMETIEASLVNPLVMPNLYNFLYNDGNRTDLSSLGLQPYKNSAGLPTAQNTVEFEGYYSVDRTSITEYSVLAGTHLDGVEMNTIPTKVSPFALPHVLKDTHATQAFHNYYSYMYRRDKLFPIGLGFDSFTPLVSTPQNANDMINDDMVYGVEPSDPKNETRHFNDFNKNSDYKMFLSQVDKMAPASNDESFFTWILNISSHMPYYDTKLFEHYKESGNFIMQPSRLEKLASEYANLNSPDQRTREAVISYLTGAHEYDRGLGVLFAHLSKNKLLDNTTIVFFADHFNNTAADLLAPTTPTKNNPAVGDAQGKMLAFYIYSPVFEKESKTAAHIIKDGTGTDAQVIESYPNPHIGRRLGNPNTSSGVIEKFITHYDIYATVCDILHIKTNNRFTLGISAFRECENVGFSIKTGLIFNNKWATFSLSKFSPSLSTGEVPNIEPVELTAAKSRLSHKFAVMNNLRYLFRNERLLAEEEAYYTISN